MEGNNTCHCHCPCYGCTRTPAPDTLSLIPEVSSPFTVDKIQRQSHSGSRKVLSLTRLCVLSVNYGVYLHVKNPSRQTSDNYLTSYDYMISDTYLTVAIQD